MVTLTWTDPTSGVLPDGYLIKASTVGFSSIANPSDGVIESSSNVLKYVSYGIGTTTLSPLSKNDTYYIKIFPYSNSGSNINYKIDSPKQATITIN